MEPTTYTATNAAGERRSWTVKPGQNHSDAYHAMWAWALS
jgi:hypothetical protein